MASNFDVVQFEHLLLDLTRQLSSSDRNEQRSEPPIATPSPDASIVAALHDIKSAVASYPLLLLADAVVDQPVGDFDVVCSRINVAIRRKVSDVLEPQHCALLKTLLARQFPDLLEMVGKERDENAHSSVLRWLLDPRCAPGIAPHALAKLATKLPDRRLLCVLDNALARNCLSVRREVTVGSEASYSNKLNRIDLLISGPDFLLAIENKIDSQEHDGQTSAYWRWLVQRRARDFHVAGLFLTPSGQPAACSDFQSISYLDIAGCLLDVPELDRISPHEQAVLAGYVRTLFRHVLRPELDAITGKTREETL